MRNTHHGCAGTRGEGRCGRVSTHTGRGQSHTRCLMVGRWQLWQLTVARKIQWVKAREIQKTHSQLIDIKQFQGFHHWNYRFPIILLISFSCQMVCRGSPAVVTGAVVLSASVGTVGVTESAGVVVSTNTQRQNRSKVVIQKHS